jgi:cell division protein FtsN
MKERRESILRPLIVLLSLAFTVVVVLIALVFAQSYHGREALVVTGRQACVRSAQNLASNVNEIRLDQSGDSAVARDPDQPTSTRDARRREASGQNRVVAVMDSHIDQGSWRLLSDPRDQRTVRYGTLERRPFRCDVAYPAASLRFF